MNLKPWICFVALGSLFYFFPSTGQTAPGKIIFVKKVPKTCKHLGSVDEKIDSKEFFGTNHGIYHAENAGPLFADSMKMKAKKMGGNRIQIAEIFHDKIIRSGRRTGYSEGIIKTAIRGRVFLCR